MKLTDTICLFNVWHILIPEPTDEYFHASTELETLQQTTVVCAMLCPHLHPLRPLKMNRRHSNHCSSMSIYSIHTLHITTLCADLYLYLCCHPHVVIPPFSVHLSLSAWVGCFIFPQNTFHRRENERDGQNTYSYILYMHMGNYLLLKRAHSYTYYTIAWLGSPTIRNKLFRIYMYIHSIYFYPTYYSVSITSNDQ